VSRQRTPCTLGNSPESCRSILLSCIRSTGHRDPRVSHDSRIRVRQCVLEAVATNKPKDPLIHGSVIDARDMTERNWSTGRLQRSVDAFGRDFRFADKFAHWPNRSSIHSYPFLPSAGDRGTRGGTLFNEIRARGYRREAANRPSASIRMAHRHPAEAGGGSPSRSADVGLAPAPTTVRFER
jgi:hypothetical protein